MEGLQGKHFSITDPKNVNTVIYQINKTEKEYLKDSPPYTLERLDYMEELRGENKRKTFFIENLDEEDNKLIILSFAKEKVIINAGFIEQDKIKISKKPIPFKFDTLYSEEEGESKSFKYTPNLKRPITIIDPETAEEIKPSLYFDKDANEIRGKCKLKPFKSYFAFEVS